MSFDESPHTPQVSDSEARQWAMFLHLSTFAGYVVPMAGLVAPIIIWQMKKEEMPSIDAHGKVVANFILSFFIWGCLCIPLVLVFIGIPLALLLSALAVIFPIIGAVKANEGVVWKYPMTITFFK